MNTELISQTIKGFFSAIGAPCEHIDVTFDQEKKALTCALLSPEPSLQGNDQTSSDVMAAIILIIKKMLGKIIDDQDISVIIDINDYRKKMVEKIKVKADILAERARSLGAEVEMEPMGSYERMIVHSLFTENKDIKTESRGLGKDRHVVIKPVTQ
jgi:predicted RNA-binding protein Jag